MPRPLSYAWALHVSPDDVPPEHRRGLDYAKRMAEASSRRRAAVKDSYRVVRYLDPTIVADIQALGMPYSDEWDAENADPVYCVGCRAHVHPLVEEYKLPFEGEWRTVAVYVPWEGSECPAGHRLPPRKPHEYTSIDRHVRRRHVLRASGMPRRVTPSTIAREEGIDAAEVEATASAVRTLCFGDLSDRAIFRRTHRKPRLAHCIRCGEKLPDDPRPESEQRGRPRLLCKACGSGAARVARYRERSRRGVKMTAPSRPTRADAGEPQTIGCLRCGVRVETETAAEADEWWHYHQLECPSKSA